jgi:hypothetical protein
MNEKWQPDSEETKIGTECEEYVDALMSQLYPKRTFEKIPLSEAGTRGDRRYFSADCDIKAGTKVDIRHLWPIGYNNNVHLIFRVKLAIEKDNPYLMREIPAKLAKERVASILFKSGINNLKHLESYLRKYGELHGILIRKGAKGKETMVFDLSTLESKSHPFITFLDEIVKDQE